MESILTQTDPLRWIGVTLECQKNLSERSLVEVQKDQEKILLSSRVTQVSEIALVQRVTPDLRNLEQSISRESFLLHIHLCESRPKASSTTRLFA